MHHLIISFIGKDRPGLVDCIAKTISNHNGNWQVSSLHHLSGFFTGVIEVAVEKSQSQALCSAISTINDLKSHIETASSNTCPQTFNLTLELTANDREGIVKDVSSVIHQQGGNLITLACHQTNAPHSGQVIFMAKAKIAVDKNDIDSLITALENIEDDLMVDITR